MPPVHLGLITWCVFVFAVHTNTVGQRNSWYATAQVEEARFPRVTSNCSNVIAYHHRPKY